eukprot:TRINITY_DN2863_c0_g1_i3.p1 TRINITY_DN2863_c0_g1~~TRINITY_DN2863_c0_g1_i3.p1  ORF type:complete len:137 (+),score=39.41 TRINITY_DN2863_c0_g1_i3:98-508(+)
MIGDGRRESAKKEGIIGEADLPALYDPLSTLGFLRDNKTARDDLLKCLPVYLSQEAWYIRMYNLKFYDAVQLQSYITYQLLVHGQKDSVLLERMGEKKVKGRYPHHHVYVRQEVLDRCGGHQRAENAGWLANGSPA